MTGSTIGSRRYSHPTGRAWFGAKSSSEPDSDSLVLLELLLLEVELLVVLESLELVLLPELERELLLVEPLS